jgi:hypothetical protein
MALNVMHRGACLDSCLHQGAHQEQAQQRPGNSDGDFEFIAWVGIPRRAGRKTPVF